MRWFLDRQQPGRAAELGLALWPFWWRRSLFQSGIGWMNEVLTAGSTLTTEERAHAALVLGMLAFGHGDYHTAEPALGTAVALHEQLGDRHGAATASVALGLIIAATAPDAGEAMLRTATASFRDLRDPWGLAFALLSLGGALVLRERFAEAEPLLTESVAVARSADAAVFTSNALINLGGARMKLGKIRAAATALREALELAAATDERESIARALDALAAVAVTSADPDRGALLVGAAERVRSSIGARVWVADQASLKETLAPLTTSLAPACWRNGCRAEDASRSARCSATAPAKTSSCKDERRFDRRHRWPEAFAAEQPAAPPRGQP